MNKAVLAYTPPYPHLTSTIPIHPHLNHFVLIYMLLAVSPISHICVICHLLDEPLHIVGLMWALHCTMDKDIFLDDMIKLRVFVSKLGGLIATNKPY